MGGGTDLLPSMKQRVIRPRVLVSLQRVKGLDAITYDKQSGLRIGALTRIRDLETSPVVCDKYPMIAQAAHAIASPQLRRMGSVGGNLSLNTRCYYYNQSEAWRKCRPACIKMGGNICNAIGGGKKCFAGWLA